MEWIRTLQNTDSSSRVLPTSFCSLRDYRGMEEPTLRKRMELKAKEMTAKNNFEFSKQTFALPEKELL